MGYEYLVPIVTAEARAVTGADITDEQARRYIARVLSGRTDIASPAAWIRARIRNHPDEARVLALPVAGSAPGLSPAADVLARDATDETGAPRRHDPDLGRRRAAEIRAMLDARPGAPPPAPTPREDPARREARLRRLAAAQSAAWEARSLPPLPAPLPEDPPDDDEPDADEDRQIRGRASEDIRAVGPVPDDPPF
ncbi:MAG: hypothetical protein FWE15_28005 [Actinomycetia bacterium]|nr:hypothetical protein [Actinomycetes bacterium]